jgi:hypothetical protein
VILASDGLWEKAQGDWLGIGSDIPSLWAANLINGTIDPQEEFRNIFPTTSTTHHDLKVGFQV